MGVTPIPEPVTNDEFVELEENKWTPAQVYYPLIEAVKTYILRQRVHHNNLKLNHYPQPPSRLVYQKYSLKTIFSMFHDTFQQYWSMGYSLVLGTEALNHIVKFHELGDDILHHVSHKLIPSSIPSNQTTVVISYQTPRIDHLLSAWRDISGVSFHDWIVNGYTGMYSILDALGMVEKIIFQTNWNVALVDIKGVQEQSSQDMPTYIACHIMNSNCNDEGLIGFDREVDKKPITRNPWLRQPDIPEGALEEIEKVFLAYDCKYKYLLKHHKSVGRLKVYQSYGMDKMTSFCDKVDIIPDIKEVKELISNIVKRYHEPSNSIIQTT